MAETPKKVVRKVKVLLTEEEKVKMGENLAHELSILDEIKERKKVVTAQLSKDVKDKESDISKLKDCINLGYEFKEKDCEMVKNFDTGLKEFWLDGEIIETEQLTAMDYQLNLQEQEEANAAEEKRIGAWVRDGHAVTIWPMQMIVLVFGLNAWMADVICLNI